MVSAIPASGPKVLPMAKVISQNLVNGSCDLQTAKENGQSAIGFLSKLASILALNVPEALEDVQSLQWKDVPLIPAVKEIHKPSKFEQNNKAGQDLESGSLSRAVPLLGYCFVFLGETLNFNVLCMVMHLSMFQGHSYGMLRTHAQWASI